MAHKLCTWQNCLASIKFTIDELKLEWLIFNDPALAKDQKRATGRREMHLSRSFTFLFCQSENVILADLQIRNAANLEQHSFHGPSGLNLIISVILIIFLFARQVVWRICASDESKYV